MIQRVSMGLLVLASGLAISQSAQTPVVFEAADVHVSAPSSNPVIRGGAPRGGLYEIHNATMVDLISLAYDIDVDKIGPRPAWEVFGRGDRIMGGPSWLDLDRFDIIASSPASSPPETVRLMLRALLAERFGLAVRNDKALFPVYALTAGPRPKLRKAEGSGGAGCRLDPPDANSWASDITFICRNATMASLAGLLFEVLATSFDSPVMDMTGLEGGWDFDLHTSYRSAPGSNNISIFDAVDRQLGLKLEPRKIERPVVVVERVSRKPTDNPPDVAKKLPAAPREFEVADIKPTAPDSTIRAFRIQPGGRIDVRGVTLTELIIAAWDLTPDMLVGTPKWLDRDRFDIVAKAPAAAAPASRPMDIDILRPMLRAMLAERFKLAMHTETQPVQVYVLTAGNRGVKLQKGDAAVRSECHWAPPPPNLTSPLTSGMACRNVTMAKFAETVRAWATAYIDRAVVDRTGIEGGWNFLLRWTPKRNIPGAFPGAAGSGGDAAQPSGALGPAADPTGGLTVFEAIEKQLGLKLELQKHPMPVLVIDSVEEKPTEN